MNEDVERRGLVVENGTVAIGQDQPTSLSS